ncbi:MAG: VCBS repeat-containing protein [Flagellimonas sp.]
MFELVYTKYVKDGFIMNGVYVKMLFVSVLTILFFSCSKKKMFHLLDNHKIGIDFRNDLTYTEDENVYLFRSFYNGAGVALSDLNNDGNLDVFFCGNQVDNRLYLGDGNFHFTDVTQQVGLESKGAWSTGVSIADVNGDGWKDIYICKSGKLESKNRRNELFINQGLDDEGNLAFKEEGKKYGVDDLGFSIHAVFLDYDRDGDLDMYLSNNSQNPTDVVLDSKRGLREIQDSGGGNKLYRNDSGYYTDVTVSAGIYNSPIGFGLGVSVGDVNRDGWPDIYVANDFFERDYLYLNKGDGTFEEELESIVPEISLGAMGVDISDLNHDGFPEIFVTEMLPKDERRLKTKALFDNWDKYALQVKNGYHRQFPRNTLQFNNGVNPRSGQVQFSEVGRFADVAASDWSWGVQTMDMDNDGNKEIFITNGIVKDLLDQDYLDFYDNPERLRQIYKNKGKVMMELIANMPSEPLVNHLYQSKEGFKYEEVAIEMGLNQPAFSTGSSYGDIDNDGDLDLVVSNLNAPPFIYRNNQSNTAHHFLSLSLKDTENKTAIGAQVSLWANGKLFYEELFPMRGSMSVVDDRLHFGLGNVQKVDSIKILWPDGRQQLLNEQPVNTFLEIKEKEELQKAGIYKPSNTFEKYQDHYLPFLHKESGFVAFDRDNLLFHSVTHEGPHIAVGDVNRDGSKDFFIGGAKGQTGAIFLQQDNVFIKAEQQSKIFQVDAEAEDQSALFYDADSDNDLDLLVASGGYANGSGSYALYDRLYINDGTGNFSKSEHRWPITVPMSTSVVVASDVDGDGDQDLFVGSRLVPGFYGLTPSSYLLENDGNGKYKDITDEKAKGLQSMGMVTDALWTDFDADGDEDLIVVGEWMSPKLFINERGVLLSRDSILGMAKGTSGLWKTLEQADLDNDGDLDLIVGNIGDNSFFKATEESPLQMLVGDFDGNGGIEQISCSYIDGKFYPMPMKKDMGKQMPFLLKKYLKFNDYQGQAITDIFDKEQLDNSIKLQIDETSSAIFWNEGGHFTKGVLPMEAQLFPIHAIHTSDVNKDGLTDIVLGGNENRAKPQTGIYASGYGLTLLNKSNRKFDPKLGMPDGTAIKGEIRDIKTIKQAQGNLLLLAKNNDSLQVIQIK